MTEIDYLAEAKSEGSAAANLLLRDTAINRNLDELVASMRTAAATDNAYNFFLLRAVAAMAVYGWEQIDAPKAEDR